MVKKKITQDKSYFWWLDNFSLERKGKGRPLKVTLKVGFVYNYSFSSSVPLSNRSECQPKVM